MVLLDGLNDEAWASLDAVTKLNNAVMLLAVGATEVTEITLIVVTRREHSKVVHGPGDGVKPPSARNTQLLGLLYS